MVNSQKISDHIVAVLPILEVHITVESGMHPVSRSNVSDSSFSHWRALSVPWGAGVAGVAAVAVTVGAVGPGAAVVLVADAAGAAGPEWVMEPSRCPHILSPFDFTAWVD